MDFYEKIKESADYISKSFGHKSFEIGVILGTGLKEFAVALSGNSISYNEIPNFPQPTIGSKSEGKITHTQIADKQVLFFFERLHLYQGFKSQEIGYQVRIMKELGIKILIMINSAATLTESINPGDIMIIKDHINMMGTNPLLGVPPPDKNKFVDMSAPYSRRLIDILKHSGNLNFKEGVYIGVTGPNFETPAEANFMRMIGGDAIGMSTIPETLVAHQCGIEVIALSCISNYSAALTNKRIAGIESIILSERGEETLVSAILNLIALV